MQKGTSKRTKKLQKTYPLSAWVQDHFKRHRKLKKFYFEERTNRMLFSSWTLDYQIFKAASLLTGHA